MSIAKATTWSAVDVLVGRFLTFGISVVLARLLAPEEFGLIAMLAVFSGLALLFIDSGFTSALIQKQDTTHEQETSVFWFNLLTAGIMALVIGLSGPAIAVFFDQPVLAELVWPMALALFIGAGQNVHTALLTKKLDFRALSIVSIGSTVLSGAVGVGLALWGAGVWALAWYAVVGAATKVLALWIIHPWRPAFSLKLDPLRPLFRFGGFLMLSGFLDQLYIHLTSILIGRFYSPAALGHYTRAESTRQVPSGLVGGIVNRVAFPALSSMQDDVERLREGVRRALQAMMVFNVPAMLGMAVVADPLVLALFGEQWLPTVPLLQVLSLAGLLWPIHLINLNVLKAQGHSRDFLRLEVFKKVVGVAAIGGAAFISVMALAWAQVVVGVVAVFINTYYSARYLGYGLRQQVQDLQLIVLAGVVMAGAVWLVHLWSASLLSRWLELGLLIAVGAGSYAGMAWLLRLPGVEAVAARWTGFRTPRTIA